MVHAADFIRKARANGMEVQMYDRHDNVSHIADDDDGCLEAASFPDTADWRPRQGVVVVSARALPIEPAPAPTSGRDHRNGPSVLAASFARLYHRLVPGLELDW